MSTKWDSEVVQRVDALTRKPGGLERFREMLALQAQAEAAGDSQALALVLGDHLDEPPDAGALENPRVHPLCLPESSARPSLVKQYGLLAALHDKYGLDAGIPRIEPDQWRDHPTGAEHLCFLGWQMAVDDLRFDRGVVALWLASVEEDLALTADGTAQGGTSTGTLKGEYKAIALLVAHPDWNNTKIAKEVPCARTTLHTWPRFGKARAALRAGKEEMPHGSKNEDHDLDAWDEDSDR